MCTKQIIYPTTVEVRGTVLYPWRISLGWRRGSVSMSYDSFDSLSSFSQMTINKMKTATAMTIERMLRTMLCSLLLVSVAMGMTLEDTCRERGFDPYQLSCDTCELLKAPEACRECCQSYKTLHGQPQRYKYAVLVYGMRGDEIKSFVEESVEEIHSAKGPGRLEVVPHELMMPSTL